MSLRIGLFFALGTAVELYGLKLVSDYISIINTISLIMFTFLVGVVVGRSYGNEYFEKMQWHLRSRRIPDDQVLNGTVMALASMLLITPGVITDLIGVLILIRSTRGFFKEMVSDLIQRRIQEGQLYFFFKD